MKNAGMKKTLERGVRAVFDEQSIEQKSVGENSEKRKFVERSLSGLPGVQYRLAVTLCWGRLCRLGGLA